jgi:peptide/nickel transport system substrate-binding protein
LKILQLCQDFRISSYSSKDKRREAMKKSFLFGALLILALTIILASCSTPSSPTTTPVPTSSATQTSPTTSVPGSSTVQPTTTTPTQTTTSATPTQASVKKGGVLKIGYGQDAATVSPLSMTRSDDFMKILPVIERLVVFDKSGLPQPWLATSWDVDATNLTITLHLKQGVKFSDGTDFNAAVCKWNLDAFRATKRAELALVSSVDVIDNNTVKLTLSKYSSTLIDSLGSYAGLMISQASYEKNGKDWAEKNPVGTGPFTMTSWDRDVSMKLQKNPNYWQSGKPYLDGLEYIIITDPTTMIASFVHGDIDVMGGIQPKDAADLQKTGKYNVTVTGGDVFMLAGDGANPNSIFANVNVRKAIDMAINREEICQAVGYGFWQPIYQLARPGSWAENPAISGNK